MSAFSLEQAAPAGGGSSALSARSVAGTVTGRQRPAVSVICDALASIAVHEPRVRALLHVAGADATARAARIDRELLANQRPSQRPSQQHGPPPSRPLAGVPVVVKDNIAVRDMPMTCGSAVWDAAPPRRDAALVRRLRRAGAVVVGKANLDEFGMGATTETSAFGASRNPLDLARTPGGSSGGSAAAVAAGEVLLAVGTDTGGSIREPAAQCGIVGVKPSHGSISLQGVVPFAPSLDQAGPMARTVVDAAMLHQAMTGPRGGRGLVEAALEGAVNLDLRGHRVGVIAEMSGAANAPGVRRRLATFLELMAGCGAELVEVSLPATAAALEVYYLISSYESLATLAGYADHSLLGAEARRRLLVGERVAADSRGHTLAATWEVADGLRASVDATWAGCTLLASPTLPVTAPLLGNGIDDPLATPRTDCWTVLANLTGIAALSLPAGECPDTGLPVGVQLMAPHGADARLYRVAAAAEAARDSSIRA
ncbi:Asp-tRNA(Asn)/Glu-tRNA(Gln) amidotransferase subunit GatA [soil metagenome]